ncbi:CRISPR-associated endonuclease Cas4g/Cas1g [Prosthecobacter debontii]
MKARMMNEFVYCPRLFYYEHVEGVFLDNADTERGSAIHEKVNRGRGSLPRARKKKKATPETDDAEEVAATEQAEAMAGGEAGSESSETKASPALDATATTTPEPEVEVIHSRSAMMSSERLGVVAKMDVIEVEMAVIPQEGWAREERGDSLRGDAASPQEVERPADHLTKKTTTKNRRSGGDEGPDLFSLAAGQDSPQAATPSPAASVSPQGEGLNKASDDAPALLHVRLNEHVVHRVTPVDYKAGSPRIGDERNELWDADKMQLGLQILILRDNGYACDEGVIYYRGTKQRVSLLMTPELEQWIEEKLVEARQVAASEVIPPPLVHSPKCVRCSLAPVCLPDETRLLKRGAEAVPNADASRRARGLMPPRRLIAARDDERALYLNSQGHRVGIKSERLIIKDGDSVIDEIRLGDVTHVALFGNIQITTQAIQELCREEIPLAYFSQGGYFYGLTRGHILTNVHTRIRQFATAANPLQCLTLAKKMVQAKIRNHRTMLMRLHVQAPQAAVTGMKEIGSRVAGARGLDELLGYEGAAAALYFQHFAGMIKVGEEDLDDEIPGLEISRSTEARRVEEKEVFTFDFTQRNRRPPRDPVNALLSLAYSLLAKDCTIAALAVGFDPYVGFYHQPRHGRPALALDLMEEFRPLIAESAVLTAINNRMVTPGHFVRAGESVNLTKHGRKAFFHAYEQRMNSLITHPVFDYKVSYRRVLELQARLLARWLTGEIPEYIPMVTR